MSGALLGLAAGVLPGPMLTLVISETLRHGKKEGIMVACVPVITDAPIILVSVCILAKLSGSDLILGIISMLGALFVCYLAYESISVKGIEVDSSPVEARSLRKGIITNFLNPHPYVFWMTIGAPLILKAYKASPSVAVLYLAGFYVFLVGSKVVVALLVDGSKKALQGRSYIYLIRALGLALLVFSVMFFRDGLGFLGVI